MERCEQCRHLGDAIVDRDVVATTSAGMALGHIPVKITVPLWTCLAELESEAGA